MLREKEGKPLDEAWYVITDVTKIQRINDRLRDYSTDLKAIGKIWKNNIKCYRNPRQVFFIFFKMRQCGQEEMGRMYCARLIQRRKLQMCFRKILAADEFCVSNGEPITCSANDNRPSNRRCPGCCAIEINTRGYV